MDLGVEAVIEQGYFRTLRTEHFDSCNHYDTLDDFETYIATWWTTAQPSRQQIDRVRVLRERYPEGVLIRHEEEQATLLAKAEPSPTDEAESGP